jgi:hypothetical protein
MHTLYSLFFVSYCHFKRNLNLLERSWNITKWYCLLSGAVHSMPEVNVVNVYCYMIILVYT